MYLSTLIPLFLFLFLKSTQACMHYTGTLPFNPTLPFEASISDNSITTCWISTTYAEHKGLEIAVLAQKQKELRMGKMKRSNGHYVKLTEKEGLLGGGEDGRGADVKGLKMMSDEELEMRRRIYGTKKWHDPPRNEKEAGFLPWEFECLQGYKAHANVGARTVTYIAHGQEFYFIPKEKEDVSGEKWIYDLKLWCGKPGKGGLVLP